MKRFGWIACLLIFCLAAACAVAAAEVGDVYEFEFAYGDEAFDRHMAEEKNEFEFDGHTYSFDLDWGDFKTAFMLYGGNTHGVLEFEVPEKKFSPEDDGQRLLLGTYTFPVRRKTTLYRFEGNRVSGEFVLTDITKLSDSFEEEVYLERDDRGRPCIIDRLYLFQEGSGNSAKYYACSLFIGYEGIVCKHKSAETILAEHGFMAPPAPAPTATPAP